MRDIVCLQASGANWTQTEPFHGIAELKLEIIEPDAMLHPRPFLTRDHSGVAADQQCQPQQAMTVSALSRRIDAFLSHYRRRLSWAPV